MLPFTKRSRDPQAGERAPSAHALPRFPLTSQSVVMQRPQLPSFNDDERTQLMPRKLSAAPPPPPPPSRRSMTPPAPPSVRPARMAPPKPILDEPTIPRSSAPPPAPLRTAPRMEIPKAPRVPAEMKSHSSAPPPPVSTDLPPAVITSSVKLSPGRPTASWAAALVALGVFGGLVTAVLARGDGDAILQASAQLVDPNHHAVAAAQLPATQSPPVAQVQTQPAPVKASCAEDTKPEVKSEPVKPAVAAVAPETAPEPKVESKVESKPPAPKPVAETKPTPAPKPVVESKPTPAPKPVVAVSKPAPKTEAVAAAPAPKPAPVAKKKVDDDAAAADALAKAQLEAALGN